MRQLHAAAQRHLPQMRHLRRDQRVQLTTDARCPSPTWEEPHMMKFNIEFIRQLPGRDEPEVIDTRDTMASSPGEAIRPPDLSLRTAGFRMRPECFRIRVGSGPIIFPSRCPAPATR